MSPPPRPRVAKPPKTSKFEIEEGVINNENVENDSEDENWSQKFNSEIDSEDDEQAKAKDPDFVAGMYLCLIFCCCVLPSIPVCCCFYCFGDNRGYTTRF